MTDRRRPRLTDLPHWLRQRSAALPDQLREVREGFRRDPVAVLHHPVVRITGLVALGGVGLLAVVWLVQVLTPAADSSQFTDATPWATLNVACTNPECRASGTVRVAMDFDDWPLTCEHCGQPSVYRAQLCPTCRRWYAVPPGQPATCPICAEKQRARQRDAPTHAESLTGDDAEDPW